MAKAGSKDIRTLVRRFRRGYRLEAAGHAKFHVVGPAGVVRGPNGVPVTLPNSPSCRASVVSAARRLRAAGVIE